MSFIRWAVNMWDQKPGRFLLFLMGWKWGLEKESRVIDGRAE